MRTTININDTILKRLIDASDILNISTNNLIEMLLDTITLRNKLKVTTFQGVRYQDADPRKNWRKLHVTFKPQVYEIGLDLRKCFKFSVSFIISFVIINFLDELVEKLMDDENDNKELDNYPVNYIFITKLFDNVQGFIILWGIPGRKHLENLLP